MNSQRKGVRANQIDEGDREMLDMPGDWYYTGHVHGWQPGQGRIPMLSSDSSADVAQFRAVMPLDYDGYCLIFNEPTNDRNPDTQMTVPEALALFEEMCNVYPFIRWVVGNNRGRHLYSEGGWWIRDFIAGLPRHLRRHVAAWGIHWYVREADIKTCVRMLRQLQHDCGLVRPIWLTEFAYDERKEAKVRIDQARQDWNIERFFWYILRSRPGQDETALIEGRGQNAHLTELGQLYLGV